MSTHVDFGLVWNEQLFATCWAHMLLTWSLVVAPMLTVTADPASRCLRTEAWSTASSPSKDDNSLSSLSEWRTACTPLVISIPSETSR